MRLFGCLLRRLGVLGIAWASLGLCHVAAADTIKIGLSVPLKGLQGGLGKEVEAVWRAFAKHASGTPLVRGHTLQVIVLDDEYEPARTKENAELLARQGVMVFAGTLGIPNARAILPVAERNRIPVLGLGGSGSQLLRGTSPAVFHSRASYAAEVDSMALLFSTIGLNRVAVITDDALDRKALRDRFAAELARASNGTGGVVGTAVLPARGGKADEALSAALASKPQAIYLLALPGQTGGLISGARRVGYAGYIASWSISATESVGREAGAAGAGVIFNTVVPSPLLDRPGLRASFQTFAASQGVSRTFRAMEVYLTGRILAEAVSRVEGEVTGAKIWAALEKMRDIRVDDWRIDFSTPSREGSAYVDTVMPLKDGTFR